MILHSISNDYGHYSPEKLSGLCTTTLRSLTNQYQENPDGSRVRYNISYHIFRTTHSNDFAKKAVEILEYQSKFRIPYDEQRLNKKLKIEEDNNFDGNDFSLYAQSRYPTHGRYHIMKYAARYPLPLVRTRADGIGRGITCSMAVALSYQISELLINKKIKSLDEYSPERAVWVSDKYSNLTTTDYPEIYLNYLKEIRQKSILTVETPELAGNSIPSYDFWRREEGLPEDFTHQLFPFDPLTIGAEGIYAYAISNPDHWHALGELNCPELIFSSEEKVLEKARRTTDYNNSTRLIALAVEKHPLLLSPRSSPSPSLAQKNSANSKSAHRQHSFSPYWFKSHSEDTEEKASPILDRFYANSESVDTLFRPTANHDFDDSLIMLTKRTSATDRSEDPPTFTPSIELTSSFEKVSLNR